MKEVEDKRFWVYFILTVLFMLFITLLVRWIKSTVNHPLWDYLDVIYSTIEIIVVLVFLAYFKRIDILLNSFKLRKTNLSWYLLGGSYFIVSLTLVAIIYQLPFDIQVFLNSETATQLYATMAEELFFRVFLIGIIIGTFSRISSPKDLLFNPKNLLVSIIAVVISAVVFSIFHATSFWTHFLKGIILYGISFVSLNNKIYPSWFWHYYNNMVNLSVT